MFYWGILLVLAQSQVPGLQYVVVNAAGTLFEYAGGWSDIQSRKAMTLDTTLMAYSMTKTFTAIAILQLVEQGKSEMNSYHLPPFVSGYGLNRSVSFIHPRTTLSVPYSTSTHPACSLKTRTGSCLTR